MWWFGLVVWRSGILWFFGFLGFWEIEFFFLTASFPKGGQRVLDVHRPCTETPDETKGRVFVLTLGCDTDPLGSGIFLTPLQSKGGQRALDAQSALVQKHLLAAMSGSPNLRLFSDVLAAVAKRVQRVSDKESMGRTQRCIVSHPPAQDLRFLVSNDESILDPTAWTTFLKKHV